MPLSVDDMIVLLVVDDKEKGNFTPEEIKMEPVDSSEVKNIIEMAEKHGEFISLKEPLSNNDCDNFTNSLQDVIKTEHIDYHNKHLDCKQYEIIEKVYVPEIEEVQNDEYEMESIIKSEPSDDYNENVHSSHNLEEYQLDFSKHIQDDELEMPPSPKCKRLKPSEWRSFVAELKKEYSELRDDEELLVNTLVQMMRSLKPPPLPKNYYVMNGMTLECVKCGHVSDTIPAAGRHYQEKHGQKYLICYACGVDYRSTGNLYKHEKRCMAPDAKVVLRARNACLKRKEPGSENDKKGYPCRYCSAVLVNRVALESHENLHRGERPFRCHACPCAYTSITALSRHTKTHTDEQFICDHCGRVFRIKASLATHMDKHNLVHKHRCNECNRHFSQSSTLKLHIHTVHRNLPPPCACQICPKRYTRMCLLKKHMRKAHGISILTRKNFFDSLPTMTETEIKQYNTMLIIPHSDALEKMKYK